MAAPLLVTIATQRSGTKFLAACLNAGTAVRSLGEPFKPGPPDSPFPAFAIGWMGARTGFAFRNAEMAALLDAFLDSLAAGAAAEGQVAHLDVMYSNLGAFTGAWTAPVNPAGDSPLCRVRRARGAGVIHLGRESLAECVASMPISRAARLPSHHADRRGRGRTAAERGPRGGGTADARDPGGAHLRAPDLPPA